MDDIVKRLAILGSTGSIGRQTLEVARLFPDRFRIVGLAAGSNLSLLTEQAREFRPDLLAFSEAGSKRAEGTSGRGLVASTLVTLEEMANHPEVDLVVVATSGRVGLGPTMAALRAGKQVALASKEVLVMAGGIVMAEAEKHNVEILPLDSEHSAIWQCLRGEDKGRVSQVILTASGGPFRSYTTEHLARVTPEEALRHPTWQMGKKVTIDAATLMNKGMEVNEAHWLFGLPFSCINVLVHPQSMVHSLVEFVDGSVKAQLGPPDMRLPIQYALSYPERLANQQFDRLDWNRLSSLAFEAPNPGKFPCLRLAIEAGRAGGTYPAVLCAADEVAVELFLTRRISFLDIAVLVEEVLEKHQGVGEPSLDDILLADAWAREYAENWSGVKV